MIMWFSLTTGLISTMLILLNSTISIKNTKMRETPSSFECGFDPSSSARLPFSLRFFLIAVIFLIFDVEITFILPLPLLMGQTFLMPTMILTLFFISILVLGLYHEWNQGALNWK